MDHLYAALGPCGAAHPVDAFHRVAVAAVREQGWIGGYKDGTFRPEKTITRAEVVKIVNGIYGYRPDRAAIDAKGSPFRDVTKSHWAYYEILEAAVSHSYRETAEGAEQWVEGE